MAVGAQHVINQTMLGELAAVVPADRVDMFEQRIQRLHDGVQRGPGLATGPLGGEAARASSPEPLLRRWCCTSKLNLPFITTV